MNDSYNKFKNKIILEKLIKSICFGLSLGLIAFSAPWIYIKVKEIEFKVWILLLIGFGVAVLATGLAYLITRPSDKKIARRLDKEFNLNEKVQTMIEYQDKDSIIVNLQRETTQDILRKTSVKKLSIKFSVLLIALMVLGCATCITAIAYPAPEEVVTPPNKRPDKEWNTDDWTINALVELIKYVENSTFNESLKEQYLDGLYGLLDNLENIKTENQKVAIVTTLIALIELELDKVNTNNEIYTVLVEAENYKIMNLAGQINFLNPEKVQFALEDLIVLIGGSQDAIKEVDPEFRKRLAESQLDKDDELYKALFKLSVDFYDAQAATDINSEIIKSVREAISTIIPLIEKQKANKDVATYIKDQLIIIFDLQEYYAGTDYGDGSTEDGGSNEGPRPELPGNGSGGAGDGSFVVGSDDLFFDPEAGIIRYGEVIEKYYGTISGQFNDGVLPKEYEQYFKDYYSILLGVYDNEESKNE